MTVVMMVLMVVLVVVVMVGGGVHQQRRVCEVVVGSDRACEPVLTRSVENGAGSGAVGVLGRVYLIT